MKNLIIITLLAISNCAFAQKNNFSGSFKIKESKSEFAGKPKFVLPTILKLIQYPEKIVISRSAFDGNSKALTHESDTFFYKGVKKKLVSPKQQVLVRKFNWLNDNSFSILTESIDQEGRANGSVTETWSLDDAKTKLILRRDIKLTGHHAKQTSYSTIGQYVRQGKLDDR